jgi:hypothetical protein
MDEIMFKNRIEHKYAIGCIPMWNDDENDEL